MRPCVQELFRAIRYILMTNRHARHDIGQGRAKKQIGRTRLDAARKNSP
jgi:hypothetical protein